MVLKKKSILLIMAFLIGCFVCACEKEDSITGEPLVEDTEEASSTEETKSAEEEAAEQWAKGYGLPVDENESKEAEADCKKMMGLYSDIYEHADKGKASNVVLSDETILEIQNIVIESGCPVTTAVKYANMGNFEAVDGFLTECMEGKSGFVIIYDVNYDGGIGRLKFIYDGTDMYVVSARGIWNDDNKPGISYISYTRIKEWKYTDKGWFGYELCVPEPPEVSEIVDGSCLIRVKPMTEEQRETSERCVRGLGYQGNNLLCSNWDTDHMDELDYNGMYEYLYRMKYQEKFNSEDFPNGIPKEEFESLIMEYLPVTEEQIRETDFELHDDGGSISGGCWKVTWCENYVVVVLSGEEQYDEQFILYFDGTIESRRLTDTEEDYVAWDKLDESRVIQEQSFDVELNYWGEVQFVSYLPSDEFYMEDVSFLLTMDNHIVYYFPAYFEDNSTENDGIGIFDSVAEVGFQDVNHDGLQDVIVIINYVTGAGPQGMLPRPTARIFMAEGNGFTLAEDLMSEIMTNVGEEDMSIANICKYIEEK